MDNNDKSFFYFLTLFVFRLATISGFASIYLYSLYINSLLNKLFFVVSMSIVIIFFSRAYNFKFSEYVYSGYNNMNKYRELDLYILENLIAGLDNMLNSSSLIYGFESQKERQRKSLNKNSVILLLKKFNKWIEKYGGQSVQINKLILSAFKYSFFKTILAFFIFIIIALLVKLNLNIIFNYPLLGIDILAFFFLVLLGEGMHYFIGIKDLVVEKLAKIKVGFKIVSDDLKKYDTKNKALTKKLNKFQTELESVNTQIQAIEMLKEADTLDF